MPSLAVDAGVAIGSFVGTMIDNTAALTAQLSLSPPTRRRSASAGHFLGVTLLVGVALVIGTTLDSVPLRVVGLLAVAPAALAVHAFRHRHEPAQALARGAFTTFVTTVGFGGDNLAVWTPLFRALSTSRTFLTVAIFAALDVGVIALARGVAGHPRVVRAATRTAPQLTPWLYLILTVVVIWECHLI